MSLDRIKNAALLGLTATAVLAVTAAAGIALGGGAQSAGASPHGVPAGSLGIGSQVAAPMSAPVTADGKVAAAGADGKAAALLTMVARKDAPVPKKAPAPSRSAASSSRSSGSTASRASSGSGWLSARVSWYGPGFYGNTMAGGGTLQTNSMVVAHRSLAFGTRIQFSYNGRTTTAVVMDRGPYVGGRVFDLGPGTAKALGFSGVGTVRYRILGR